MDHISINKVYKILLKLHGPQGWWPITSFEGGYHPSDYSIPRTESEQFEICVGAILTQNTNWPNVEMAIKNLTSRSSLTPHKIAKMKEQVLAEKIKPSGYFNQKAKKLKVFTNFFLKLKGRTPNRNELLDIWGIGPETADSILLYAYSVPTFVIDAYTMRIMQALKLLPSKCSYEEAKSYFESTITPDLKIYQEYHALIVQHAKEYFSKKKDCPISPLLNHLNQSA